MRYFKSLSRHYSTGSTILFKGNKNKVVNAYFGVIDSYDLSLFSEKMLNINLDVNNVYTVYVKVRYSKDSFFMVGNQFGFKYESEGDFEVLFGDMRSRLEEYFSHYNLVDEDIIYIQVSFRLLDRMVYSDISIDKEVLENVTVMEKKDTLALVSIPTTTEEDSLGQPLPLVIDKNNKIIQVNVIIKGIKSNFLDTILEKTKYIRSNHKDVITEFDNNYKFYYIKSTLDYILVVKELGHNSVEKLKYSTSGVLLSKITDKLEGNLLIRSKGSETMYIENDSVIKTTNLITFTALEKYKVKNISWLPNTNIGSIDIETYLNNNNVHEIYALGFRTKLDSEPVVYYINDKYDSDTLVLTMIDELLRSKYSDITFYCHNLGGYDVIFILKILNNYNDNKDNKEKYKLSFRLRDNKVIKLKITKDNKSLVILDSYCVLTSSLKDLAEDFEVKTQKSVFPYEFSRQNHLFYKGNTPGIHLYKDITIEDYKEIYKQDWSFKDETIKYLKDDLNCLYEILISANNQFFEDYKINIMEALTISGLAMKIYLSKFYSVNIPSINKPSIYKDIKKAYYGGKTGAYGPYGGNLNY